MAFQSMVSGAECSSSGNPMRQFTKRFNQDTSLHRVITYSASRSTGERLTSAGLDMHSSLLLFMALHYPLPCILRQCQLTPVRFFSSTRSGTFRKWSSTFGSIHAHNTPCHGRRQSTGKEPLAGTPRKACSELFLLLSFVLHRFCTIDRNKHVTENFS
jgi:hypothetical protein